MPIELRKVICVFFLCFGAYELVITETCHQYDEYGKANIKARALERDFDDRLHAQHLVTGPIIYANGSVSFPVSDAIRSHLADPNPSKALVLYFQGPTGVGKNFVSNIIADNLFDGKRNSKYVHTIMGPHHFPDKSQLGSYKTQLQSWISSNVSLCKRSLFIIDEIDKFPPGLLDTVKGFLGHHPMVDGLVYRKTIFIFISNTAGEAIKRYVYEQRLRPREDLTVEELEGVAHEAVSPGKGGLPKPEILDKHLVSVYVPFLPMERAHVRLCVRDDLISKGYHVTDEVVEAVLQETRFFPTNFDGEQIQFSETGCKRVPDVVDWIVYKRNLKRRGEL